MPIEYKDMTDEKLKYDQLELLQLIMDNAHEIMWVVDKNYCLLYANKAYQEAIKSSGGKIISLGECVLRDDYPNDFLVFWRDIYNKCFNGELFVVESEVAWADGKHYIENSLKPLKNKNNEIIGALVISLDITLRKQTLIELQTSIKKYQISENDLKQAQAVAHLGNWKWDLKTSEIIWSDEMFNIFGIDKNSYTGRLGDVIAKVIHPDDLHIVLPSNAPEIAEKKPIEYRIITQDKSIKYIWASAAETISDDNGSPLFLTGIAQDITEQKLVEIELSKAKAKAEENEIRLRIAQKASKAGTWDWDIVNNTFFWSDEFLEIFGMPKETIAGFEAWTNALHPDDIEIASKRIQESITNKTELINDFRIILPDKSIKWIRATGTTFYEKENPLRMIGLCFDITNQKLAELALIESEEKYRYIFENSPIGLFRSLIDGNKIISVNKKFCEIFEYTKEEIIGKPSHVIWKNPVEREKALNKLKEIGALENYEAELLTKNGKVKNILISVKIYPEKGIIEGSNIDITERKHIENEFQKAKEKAEESERLKTAFLQNMSHEIRTPLNAISGFSGMLNKPDLSEEKRKSFVSIIQNSSKQLVSNVTDILTISSLETKQEKLNLEKVCINNIIVDLLAIFKQQAQNQNVSLYTKQQLSDKQSEIYTDKTKITQILTNLLTNALKFTHEGFIEFGYNLKSDIEPAEMEFYVKDSGIGIKSEYHKKIFERFRQADNSINKLYGGTGLGLAISKAFVELLGGKIWVQSELEKGATFYFTIPYKPVNEIDKITTPTKQNENFRTVLVAEDEEYNFLFIEELLIELDLKVIHAKDGKETIEIFKSNSNIDLILMDIKMPIMSGHEAARIIKELKPDLPIVAQSAYALEHERAKYEEFFDDYLTKPIDENKLKQMVMKYIEIGKINNSFGGDTMNNNLI